VQLHELAARAGDAGLDLAVVGSSGADPEVDAVVLDSRRARGGTLFCCVHGERADGHDFAPEAVANGAGALVVERELDLAVPQLLTADARAAVGHLAAALEGHPSRSLRVIGVTGTNGKTTVTHLLRSVLDEAGQPCGVIGTLMDASADQPPTTPDAPELQRLLAAERDAGRAAVAMEVSSHALAQGRVNGTWFAVAMFTNLGRDHLDFHRTLDAYFDAKASLFAPQFTDLAVINLDDHHGRRLAEQTAVRVVGYTLAEADRLEIGPSGSTFMWRDVQIELALGGSFNVSNAIGAATVAAELGVAPAVIARGIAAVDVVPGRWERIEAGQPFTVVVDYAHTPDALEVALDAARGVARTANGAAGQVIVVFGAGGDKDREKRSEMGRVAAAGADRVVLTSDNPRSEDPLAIIAAVRDGIAPEASLVVEPDRREAIQEALADAAPGDVVLIAGKGHETYQEVAGVRHAFDDRAVAHDALKALGW
jgi:UDP-N-acetylmuramoyl-L-alanyl-D-glutamate--2,6-diaminopimelate ligase